MPIYLRNKNIGVLKNATIEDIEERIIHYRKLKDQAEDLFFNLEADLIERSVPRNTWEEINRYIHTKRDYESSKELLFISESIKASLNGVYYDPEAKEAQ